MVLKTTAESGALGSPARVTVCLVRGSVPSTAPTSAGEGNSLTMRSMSGWTPRPLVDAAARTGTRLPDPMALPSAPSISSSLMPPSSRYLERRSSSVSATASISFSRHVFASSMISPGTSASFTLPSAVTRAFMATRSTTPAKVESDPTGIWSGHRRPLRRFWSDSRVRKKSARSRSRRLITMARGSAYSLAYFQTFSVCPCTPATASTTMMAALAARSPALASATKSPYPGVSIRLRRWPFQSQKATVVRSEILRLNPSGSKSVVVVPSSTLPSRLMAPAAKRMPSTRDVLPTPPCPAKPTLRILEMSVAMPASPRPHRVGKRPLQEKGRCGRGCYHSVTECSSGHWVNLLRHTGSQLAPVPGACAWRCRLGADDFVREHADLLDLGLHAVPGLEEIAGGRAHPVRRAGGDDVAGQHRHATREDLDALIHREDHLGGVAGLAHLSVDAHGDVQGLRIRDLVCGDEDGPHGAEGVERLALEPLRVPLLEIARRHVVDHRVAEDGLEGVGAADVPAGRAEGHGRLDLVVELRGDRVMDHVVTRTNHRGAGLGEVDGMLGHGGAALRRVVGVVPAQAEDVARGVLDRREEADALDRIGELAPGEVFDGLLLHEALAMLPGLAAEGPGGLSALHQLEEALREA